MIEARSLRWRLLLGAAVLILLAVGATGLALSALFCDQVRAQYDTELISHLNQLTALLEPDGIGPVRLRGQPSDPRFQAADGGRYWQIEHTAQSILRSRSLWDRVLALPHDSPPPGDLDRHVIEVAGIGKALVVERVVRFRGSPADGIRVAVALPVAEVDAVTARFDRALALALAVLAAGLILASGLQVAIGLMPLARLGRALARVHSGASARLDGDFPAEVRPLVDELNGLLGQQERQVERARSQAGDLAHGLSTSLQLLLVEADRLSEVARDEVDRIRAPVLRMQAVIEHQLARARAQTGAQQRGREAQVAASVDALVRVLGPIAAERGIAVAVDVAPGARFAGEAADLEEMLGNLLDNACKWARTRVRLFAQEANAMLEVTVEDDGPGLDAGQRKAVFARGARLDQRMPGSGLGLAIARDLAEIYGGRIELGHSSWGGLRAGLQLPGTGLPFRSRSGSRRIVTLGHS